MVALADVGRDDRSLIRRAATVTGAAVVASVTPAASALASRPVKRGRYGDIRDIKHVMILMQENRSFDHYFGSLKGVRGFGDRSTITLPGGYPVWQQPTTPPGQPVTGTQYPWQLSSGTFSGAQPPSPEIGAQNYGGTSHSAGAVQANLSFSNNGPFTTKASHFSVYNNAAPDANIADYPGRFPGQYTIEPSPKIWNKTVSGSAEVGAGSGEGRYDLTIVGPNRFLRHFTGDVGTAGVTAQVTAVYYQGGFSPKPVLALKLANNSNQAVTFTVAPNYYSKEASREFHVPAHSSAAYVIDPLATSDGWYDLSVTISGDDAWSRRYLGHLEDGDASITG